MILKQGRSFLSLLAQLLSVKEFELVFIEEQAYDNFCSLKRSLSNSTLDVAIFLVTFDRYCVLISWLVIVVLKDWAV